jgi:hypothetical protein
MPGAETEAAGLRKPKIVHAEGKAALTTMAPPAGKVTVNSPSWA